MVNWMKEASERSDAEWYALTKKHGQGYCGGCGETDCHVGQECVDSKNGHCIYCPDRKELIENG